MGYGGRSVEKAYAAEQIGGEQSAKKWNENLN